MRGRRPAFWGASRFVLLALAIGVAACGRYGPPLREPPVPAASERPGGGLVPVPAPPGSTPGAEEENRE